MEECLQLGRALRYGDAVSFFQVYDCLLEGSTASDDELRSLKELARQISELPNEDFSLLETATQLPFSVSLPGLTTEAHLAAVVEKLRQEAYYSDSGAVSDFDGSVSEGARSRSNSLQSKEENSDLKNESDCGACHRDVSVDSIAITLAGQCVLADQSCKPHGITVSGDEARQDNKMVSTSGYLSTSAQQPTSLEDRASMKPKPTQRVEDSDCSCPRKPSRMSDKQPTNQLRTADSHAQQKRQEKQSHWQKGSSNVTFTASNGIDNRHQHWYHGPQRRQSFPRKKPRHGRIRGWRQTPERQPHQQIAQERRTSMYWNSPSPTLSHCSDNRYQGSFNHLEVVQFLWQGWLQVQKEQNRSTC